MGISAAEITNDTHPQTNPEKNLEYLEKPIHPVPAAGRTPQGFRADPGPAVRAKPGIRLRGYKFLPALLAFESFSQVFIRDFILGFALPAFASHFFTPWFVFFSLFESDFMLQSFYSCCLVDS